MTIQNTQDTEIKEQDPAQEFINELNKVIKNSSDPDTDAANLLCELLDINYDNVYSSEELNEITEALDFSQVLREGGGEGGAEHVYIVFKALGKYFSTSCSYYSNYGYSTDYILEYISEVHPEERTITVYV